MQLTLPTGTVVDDPDETKIVEAVNNMDPNRPETLRLARTEEDWIEASIVAEGLVMRNQDPATGLTLQTKGPYLSKATVITTLKAYLAGDAKWNMHCDWAPASTGKGR